MRARVRAELVRLATQGWVWLFAALLTGAAVWTARWSPAIVDLGDAAQAGPRRMVVSVGGAAEVAATQLATGLGVVLAALFAAAGPGRDFVDGSAEVRRASATAGLRFASRVVAVTTASYVAGLAALCALVGLAVLAARRNDYALALQIGPAGVPIVVGALALCVAHATWVVALAQSQRNQATQFALPAALVVAMFLVSRLSPYPVTPDAWVGPLVGLRSERAMLDFWWSVGGEIVYPWGNVTLLAVVIGAVAASAIRADRASRSGPSAVARARAPRTGPLDAERDRVARDRS